MLKLALRNILRHKVRSAMTLAAIVFGVVGLIVSGGFVRDIYIQLGEALIHSQTGHLQVYKAGFYSLGSRSPEKYVIEQPEAAKRIIAGLPQVRNVMARLSFSGLINNGRSDWAIVGEGVEPEKEAQLGTHLRISSGRALKQADANGIMIGSGVAEALSIKPGDQVTLLLTTPEGALNTLDFDVVGVFQSFSRDFDARAVRIPLAAAQELLNTKGVNALVIELAKSGDTAAVAAQLRDRLDAAQFEVKTWIELNDFYEKTVALYERQFGVLQLIILAMVLLSVANSVNMSVFERVGEFGTLMALGNHSGYVTRLVIAENLLQGLIGSALGVVAGVALALAISAIGIPMPPPPNANVGYTATIRIVPSVIATAYAVGLIATVCAAVLPARRVGKVPVVDALRQNV